MSCPNCNSSSSVAVGRKHYCANCGDALHDIATPARSMDMVNTRKTAPVKQEVFVAPTPITPVSVVAPVAKQRLMRDLGGPVAPAQHQCHESDAKPAASFHARLRPARGGVLDLREAKPKAAAATPVPTVAPTSKVVMNVKATKPAAKKHTSIAASAMHIPAKAQLTPKPQHDTNRQHTLHKRLESSAIVPRSDLIKRFSHESVRPVEPVKVSAKPQPQLELPAQTAMQHEHLTRLIEVMKNDGPGAHPQATKPSRASFATAALAVAVIGTYIWFHNYPHLAISAAADKAGFSASLPGFVPSSYSLKGDPSYSPGLVTLSFASPSFSSPLKVTQQPTAWDSSSLMDNYVATKKSPYTTVDGQGLTIYLLDGSKEATWINHGIWYSVVGSANVSRDQLLKMAYSF